MIRIAINLFDAQESRKLWQRDPTKSVGPNQLPYENGHTMTNTVASINY